MSEGQPQPPPKVPKSDRPGVLMRTPIPPGTTGNTSEQMAKKRGVESEIDTSAPGGIGWFIHFLSELNPFRPKQEPPK